MSSTPLKGQADDDPSQRVGRLVEDSEGDRSRVVSYEGGRLITNEGWSYRPDQVTDVPTADE